MKDRKQQRKYHGDVVYEVWRRGGNPDAIDYNRVEDARYQGKYFDDAASIELRNQRKVN